MQKRLIIDVRMIHHSGIGTYLKNLIPVIKDCFETILLGCSKELAAFEWGRNLKIIETSSPIYSIKEQFELPRKIPKADVFWSPHYNIPVFPIRAKKRVVTIHDVFHLAFYHQLSIAQKIYARQIYNRAVDLSDKIITVSEFSKSEIVKYTNADPEKISAIHCGVNKNLFKIHSEVSLVKRKKNKYHLPDQFILFVGNVKPHKNLKGLILAFQKLQEKIQDVFLVVVGKREGFITADEELSELLNNDPDLDKKILFKSSVSDSDLPFFYNLASVFAFPSLYEGFGLPPLEAMACGCPTIISNIGSLSEVSNGAAYTVNPFSIEDIADGLYNILNNLNIRQELREKGLKRIKHFNWKESAEKHLELLDQLMSE